MAPLTLRMRGGAFWPLTGGTGAGSVAPQESYKTNKN